MKDKKKILYAILIASFIPVVVLPILFLPDSIYILPTDIVVVIGSWLGLFAFMVIFWQYVLGLKFFVSRFTNDVISINKLHQTLGIYGFFLIIAHPVLVFLGYFFDLGQNIINLNFATQLDIAVKFGDLALVLIVVNWLLSYYIRSKLTFRWWKRIHLFNYLILPIVVLHAHEIGTFLQDPILKIYFLLIVTLFALIFLYRLGSQLGYFKYKYKVTEISEITHDIKQLKLSPVKLKSFINPLPGQFIEVQINQFGETHPFTVSEFNSSDNSLSISPKNSGKYSSELFNLKTGAKVFLSGPYGVFTREAYSEENKNLVLIAGGIGITPFLRFFDYFEQNSQNYNKVYSFYGNKTIEDIAYKDKLIQLQKFSNFKLINVLSNEKDSIPGYEYGFINNSVMKKYLEDDLNIYKFFVCGPPVMMSSIKKELISLNIDDKDIFSEKFSW